MNSKIIENLYDLFDEACMILYDELNINYVSALNRISYDLKEGINDSLLSDKSVEKLEEIYQKIMDCDVSNKEEIRLATQLLGIKGLKHINYSLDVVVPDAISFIIANIIKKKYCNKNISILDTTLRSANMLLAISTFLDNDNNLLYGIENDEKLVELAIAQSNILNNPISIFMQEDKDKLSNVFNVVIGMLESKIEENSYLPYEIIDTRINNISHGGYFIYIIDNDFFMQEKINEFKNLLMDKATLVGLITLPNSIVQQGKTGKSIIIGKKEILKSFEMMIVNVKDFNIDTLENAVKRINIMIDKI